MVADLLEETPLLCNISLAEDSIEIDWNLAKLRKEQDTVPLYDNIKKYLAGVTNIVPKGLTAPITQFFVENELIVLEIYIKLWIGEREGVFTPVLCK